MEIKNEMAKWENKHSASIKEIQSKKGKLSFASSTVKAGRLFFSRIIEFMNLIPKSGKRRIPCTVKKDIRWWENFVDKYHSMESLRDIQFFCFWLMV